MARYDRIARLDPPPRWAAFPGWLVLRDLEGRERDPELSRRVRIRFLALRPAQRLLARGMTNVDDESLGQQVAFARAELDRLPEGDPERIVLADYLDRVMARAPGDLVPDILAVGAACQAIGHRYGAEEFYRTAVELAEDHALSTDRGTDPASTVALAREFLSGLEPRAGTELDPGTNLMSDDLRAIARRIASMGRERVPSG